jgi:uncharacterized membrane protein YjjB (DUF3815 family)
MKTLYNTGRRMQVWHWLIAPSFAFGFLIISPKVRKEFIVAGVARAL